MSYELMPLGIAALALLTERPMHPYEMYQILLLRKEDRIVKVRPGSLYHAVNKLEEGGLVRLDWTLESEAPTPAADVESFFRIENPDQSSRLIEAITALVPPDGLSTPDQEGSLA